MMEVYQATRLCIPFPIKKLSNTLNKKTGKHFKHNTAKSKDFIKARWNQSLQVELKR